MSSKKIVTVGILGTADIAARYAIPAFQSLPHVKLVAIGSRSVEKAREMAARYGLEPESYESLIARDDIDVIYSPLPVGIQEEWTIKAAAAGKHVICEKSITYSLESAQRMVNSCRENGVALYENFVPEFHPQHAKILSLINEQKIGIPHVWNGAYGFPPFPSDDIRYSADLKGGALNDCGCYTVFMARKIMQQEPIAVTCTLEQDGKEVDIKGSALLEFENGEALMSFGFDHLYQNTYSVWGSRGLVRTNRAFAIPPTFVPAVELITNDGAKDTREDIEIPTANQFALSFDFFCQAVVANDTKQFEEMYDRIIRQASVLEAMRISASEGRRVSP
ncbi:MAG: Gfo/Idh/MocA family oxidoreductase [Candidatus Woesebacteria bacterium]|nr:Gfo/Idh/MocA family oxidoreductase [Candidatus Woesebacteria bacterium]